MKVLPLAPMTLVKVTLSVLCCSWMLPLAAPARVRALLPLMQKTEVAALSAPAAGASTVRVGAGLSRSLAVFWSPATVAVTANE